MGASAKQAVDRRRPPSRSTLALEAAVDADARPLLGTRRSLPLPAEPPPRLSRAVLVICAALAAAYFACYATSLMGGTHSRDLAWINAHLNTIGRTLILSILAFTAYLWAARGLGAAAWPARLALASVHLALLAWDHGGDFQHHGLYNWVLFLLIALPLNLVLLGLFFWYTSMPTPRAFAASFLASGAALALGVALALVHYQRMATVGFFGHRMQPGCAGRGCPPGSEPNCNFPTTLPWIDLLPKGSQNFWTGSQHCPRIHSFDATLTEAGLLTISRCPAHERQTYTPLPSTRLWSIEQKTHERATYQSNVLKKLKPEPYHKPVQLGPETEAVLARCGEAERLLTRVAPRLERLPPEPPLVLLNEDEQQGEGGLAAAAAAAAGAKGKAGTKPKGGARRPAAEQTDAQEEEDDEGARERESDAAAAASGKAGGKAGGDGNGGGSGKADGSPEWLNVLVIFIDSLGRRHFFRRMPRSAAALEAVARRGSSQLHQFFRYHVVGFHTDPNSHVMYTGSPIENQHAQPFWHSYRRAGYVSGSVYNLCEDWGAEYDHMQTPHDHELVAPFCLPEYHPVTPDGEPYQMFKGAFSILRCAPGWLAGCLPACASSGSHLGGSRAAFLHQCQRGGCVTESPRNPPPQPSFHTLGRACPWRRRCLRGRHVHEYNFEWMRQFMAAYDGKAPWLLLSTFHEAHEGGCRGLSAAPGWLLWLGTGEVVATMDADLAAFYQELSPDLLNRTAVITVADHGATMGLNYMYTQNGRITEHKIPFLALLLPPWVERRYPAAAAALRANEQRFVSHYDFFTTLHHLLHLGESAAPLPEQYPAWREAGNVTEAVRWGVSLLDEVPPGRSCDDAGIPAEWCRCFLP
ncbi:hypothetical protein ABPG75_007307 [Micractinium tetrahymenae]